MNKAKTIPALLAALSVAGPTVAGPDHATDDCWVPLAEWQSRSAAEEMARQSGWDVRRIKIDHGCYEIIGYDQQGRPVEVIINPATFELIRIEYEDDSREHGRKPGSKGSSDDDDDDGSHDDSHGESGEHNDDD